jgi:hypothetical protein
MLFITRTGKMSGAVEAGQIADEIATAARRKIDQTVRAPGLGAARRQGLAVQEPSAARGAAGVASRRPPRRTPR